MNLTQIPLLLVNETLGTINSARLTAQFGGWLTKKLAFCILDNQVLDSSSNFSGLKVTSQYYWLLHFFYCLARLWPDRWDWGISSSSDIKSSFYLVYGIGYSWAIIDKIAFARTKDISSLNNESETILLLGAMLNTNFFYWIIMFCKFVQFSSIGRFLQLYYWIRYFTATDGSLHELNEHALVFSTNYSCGYAEVDVLLSISRSACPISPISLGLLLNSSFLHWKNGFSY